MLKTVFVLAALCAVSVSPAKACTETGTVTRPSCMGQDNNPFSGAISIRVTTHRVRHSANPRSALSQETAIGEKPAGCPHAWCGCYLALHLGIQDRSLWLARNWAAVGHPVSGPQVGAIAVWRHHVGRITAVDGNRILLLSGNDGRAVRERWRSMRGIIAFRTM